MGNEGVMCGKGEIFGRRESFDTWSPGWDFIPSFKYKSVMFLMPQIPRMVNLYWAKGGEKLNLR